MERIEDSLRYPTIGQFKNKDERESQSCFSSNFAKDLSTALFSDRRQNEIKERQEGKKSQNKNHRDRITSQSPRQGQSVSVLLRTERSSQAFDVWHLRDLQ